MAHIQLFGQLATVAIMNARLYENLQKTLQEQDLFVSIAAHEIKTPLAALTVYAQLLFREKLLDEAKMMKYNKKIMQQITRLTQLADELLQVSKMQGQIMQYNMKRCSIRPIIKKSIADFQRTHAERLITFTNEKAIRYSIKGDKDKLYQVFVNLLTNAAKFSAQDKPILITLTSGKSELIIKVSDHGIGISEKHLPYIFDRFYKGSKKQQEGLGLGLFLVKNIIEQHNGTVTATSRLRKGTEFTISLPTYVSPTKITTSNGHG